MKTKVKMIPFTSFLNKRCKFEDIFRLADQLGLDSTECINPANKVLHSLKREDFRKKYGEKIVIHYGGFKLPRILRENDGGKY